MQTQVAFLADWVVDVLVVGLSLSDVCGFVVVGSLFALELDGSVFLPALFPLEFLLCLAIGLHLFGARIATGVVVFHRWWWIRSLMI